MRKKLKIGEKVGFYYSEHETVPRHEFYDLPKSRKRQLIGYGVISDIVCDSLDRVFAYVIVTRDLKRSEVIIRVDDIIGCQQ